MNKRVLLFFVLQAFALCANNKQLPVVSSSNAAISDEAKKAAQQKDVLSEDIIEETFEKAIHWGRKKIEPWWNKRYIRYSVYGLVAFRFFVPTIMSIVSVTRGWTSNKNGAQNPSGLTGSLMDGLDEWLRNKPNFLSDIGRTITQGAVDQLKDIFKAPFVKIAEKIPDVDGEETFRRMMIN